MLDANTLPNSSTIQPRACAPCSHCGTPSKDPGLSSADGKDFCCLGCRTVFETLQSLGLEEYYALRDRAGTFRKLTPASTASRSFLYLDDAEFRKLYSHDASVGKRMDFYLEGIHCVACVWLLERAAEWIPHLIAVQVDAGRSTASVTVADEGSFARVATEFSRLGYTPHPIRQNEESRLRKKEEKLLLIRMAVAAACSGNIMLLAFAIYAGAHGRFLSYFNWISLGLFTPVLLFSSVPFYRGAISALRAKSISIEVPIAFGIVAGFGASALNLLWGSPEVYFDSLSALVFLLLASRLLLKRAQQDALESSNLLHFLAPSLVRVVQDGICIERDLNGVHLGDLVEVRAGEIIPIDGTIEHGASYLNCALLTGEVHSVPAAQGTPVFAGSTNLSAPIRVRVNAAGYSTRLGKILKDIESRPVRAPLAGLVDRVGKYFVWAAFVLSGIGFYFGLQSGFHEAFNRALAMIIVTCPCAFALATPLALSSTIGKAARNGILIKSADVLERLSKVNSIYLDKTGTLTEGSLAVLNWNSITSDLEPEIFEAVFALESRSVHPIARALTAFLQTRVKGPLPEPRTFREEAGKGISARFRGHDYRIGRSDSITQTGVGTRISVWRDERLVAEIELGDLIRPDAREALARLKGQALRLHILSGDRQAAVEEVARRLANPDLKTISEASPEEKKRILMAEEHAMMVGDGANDAVALSAAFVGVAAHGGMEVSLRAADVYLTRPGMRAIPLLITAGRETLKTIRLNLIFSLIYNALGITAAFAGKVNPLFAALLMPASAMTVFLSSIAGTRTLRKALKEEAR